VFLFIRCKDAIKRNIVTWLNKSPLKSVIFIYANRLTEGEVNERNSYD
jgi:hypothetical protein